MVGMVSTGGGGRGVVARGGHVVGLGGVRSGSIYGLVATRKETIACGMRVAYEGGGRLGTCGIIFGREKTLARLVFLGGMSSSRRRREGEKKD
ncbi:unnamed protein product, partial [Dovyalis caffra]